MSNVQSVGYSVNLLRAILWQHNEASSLQSLLTDKQTWYTAFESEFWSDWYRDVFDLRTANDFGCSVWAIILGLPISFESNPIPKPNFGFGAFHLNFNKASFGTNSATNVTLTTEQKRLLLRLRYVGITIKPTVPKLNRAMQVVFAGMGNVYVEDSLDMSFLTYVFDFTLDPAVIQLINKYDLLPRPSTVGVRFLISTGSRFGFGEFNKNFNTSTFADLR